MLLCLFYVAFVSFGFVRLLLSLALVVLIVGSFVLMASAFAILVSDLYPVWLFVIL